MGEHVRLFRNGRSQTASIPRDFDLSVAETISHRDNGRLISEPVQTASLSELFAHWPPLDEAFPEIDCLPAEPVDIK
ncbi:AbrB/MazE/SpoVT family DNA-binding domain-containing protein [Burkholderia sp. MS455]|nr:AbrB/MazE/SpoVT family DNA-binding domain-containing protein [Burkholderia sp. MS455]